MSDRSESTAAHMAARTLELWGLAAPPDGPIRDYCERRVAELRHDLDLYIRAAAKAVAHV